jgi:hypothetical protein
MLCMYDYVYVYCDMLYIVQNNRRLRSAVLWVGHVQDREAADDCHDVRAPVRLRLLPSQEGVCC